MRKYIIAISSIIMLAITACASFPVDEAGIAAYVSIGSSVDLNKTYAAYEDVVNTSQTHIIGTVRIANLIGDSVPLVYVGADGWVVAYYPKTEPASKITQWNQYTAPYVNTTTLADAISKMATALGVSYESIKGNIKYYDFRYPEATLMTMVMETKGGGWGENSFNLTIPQRMTLYDASYSHYYSGSQYYSILIIDETYVSQITSASTNINYGYYNITRDFKKDIPHRVRITGENSMGASTVLIYRN